MSNYQNLLNQGPVFWAAAAAVAGGITLLLVSLTLHIRKIFSNGVGPYKSLPAKMLFWRKKVPANYPKINITDTGYGLAGKATMPEATFATAQKSTTIPIESQAIHGLLLRLRQAGDQLEQLQENTSTPITSSTKSLLKQRGDNVEYLIRTGIS